MLYEMKKTYPHRIIKIIGLSDTLQIICDVDTGYDFYLKRISSIAMINFYHSLKIYGKSVPRHYDINIFGCMETFTLNHIKVELIENNIIEIDG